MNELQLLRNTIIGCAIGDSLGYPFEFGYPSQKEFNVYYDSSEPLEISDDTQMTLFTLDGLVHAFKNGDTSTEGVLAHIASAYLSWYGTQLGQSTKNHKSPCHLMQYKGLFKSRAPGGTCLDSLDQLQLNGTVKPNDRKGAGANMRVAPLAFLNLIGIEFKSKQAMDIAVGSALITHKHPLITQLMPIQQCLMANVKGNPDFIAAVKMTEAEYPFPSWLSNCITNSDKVEGWIAEEALGIAIAANCKFDNFRDMMGYCICREGDSDTVAAIAGGLWGLSGNQIPDRLWQRSSEMSLIEDFLAWCNIELGKHS